MSRPEWDYLLSELVGGSNDPSAGELGNRIEASVNAELTRLRAAVADGLEGPPDKRAHPDFSGAWRAIFGDQKRWAWLTDDARKYGKHWASNNDNVRALLERLKSTDPAGADTLAAMIFWRQIADNREVEAWKMVDEGREESARLRAANKALVEAVHVARGWIEDEYDRRGSDADASYDVPAGEMLQTLLSRAVEARLLLTGGDDAGD